MHHMCFEVEDILAARDALKAAGARVLGDGEPKIGAHGKPVPVPASQGLCRHADRDRAGLILVGPNGRSGRPRPSRRRLAAACDLGHLGRHVRRSEGHRRAAGLTIQDFALSQMTVALDSQMLFVYPGVVSRKGGLAVGLSFRGEGLTPGDSYRDIFAVTVIKTTAAFVVIGFSSLTGLYQSPAMPHGTKHPALPFLRSPRKGQGRHRRRGGAADPRRRHGGDRRLRRHRLRRGNRDRARGTLPGRTQAPRGLTLVYAAGQGDGNTRA